ncbi:MAG TPA: NfeD family protein [Gemmataceae bacterium]|nr:NfeD family protein [Gemmataceae bacterium]
MGCLFAALLVSAGLARSQEVRPEGGLFITVQNPITSDVVNRVVAKSNRALSTGKVTKLIFDFNPAGHPASSEEYGACRDLAAHLLHLKQCQTVAFVHNEVTGHTVLPVLACQEIVMSREAKLGRALLEEKKMPLREQDDDRVVFYRTVVEGRYPPAIVLKMLDRKIEVVEATWKGGVWYIDKARQAEEAAKGVVVTRPEPILPRGDLGFYTAADAQKFGLCRLQKESRTELAEAYQLSPSSLREDPLEGREPNAVRIKVDQRLTPEFVGTIDRMIRQAIARQANFIILQLEANGGDTKAVLPLAEKLRTLKDDKEEFPVMTVAYIPQRAADAAVFLALGCTEIVMGKDAEIGDFDAEIYERRGGIGRVERNPEDYRMTRESLIGLAREQGYSPVLAQGMLDKTLTIYRVQSQKGQAEWRLMSEAELREDEGPAGAHKWGNKTLIKAGGEKQGASFLRLRGEKARELGLAREIANDYPDLLRLYGLPRVRDAGFDFLYQLAQFLRLPLVSVFLIMIGIACLILELKMPGVGLPGVIAAVCFVLYFWAQSKLSGELTMLAILLFILGLVLIGLEIFLMPGFTVPGISGAVLIVVSLALATLERKPETTQEWLSFGRALGAVGLSLAGAITLAFLAAWYLPSIPYANRLILKPPAEAREGFDGDEAAPVEGLHPALAALLGAIGVAATALRPAGIARFGDDFVDVVSEGSYIAAGTRVQVVEIEGNRVVVKEV